MTARFPFVTQGQRIGLLGGSFDPPHAGHLHITKQALKRFQLDRVWWMVTPGNPLKKREPIEIRRRVQACLDLVDDPRIIVTDIETWLGTRYTAATLKILLPRYIGVRFMWLIGSDSLVNFHHWKDWNWIIETVPIGVMARPGQQLMAIGSRAARRYAQYRVQALGAEAVPLREAPTWCMLNGQMVDLSSTQIRALGDWDVSKT